jgi:hypothetical protein
MSRLKQRALRARLQAEGRLPAPTTAKAPPPPPAPKPPKPPTPPAASATPVEEVDPKELLETLPDEDLHDRGMILLKNYDKTWDRTKLLDELVKAGVTL